MTTKVMEWICLLVIFLILSAPFLAVAIPIFMELTR